MDTDSTAVTVATYIERLQQAIRVMEGLSATEQVNFTLHAWAVRRGNGMTFACIAGYCGLDPWFQAHGLVTTIQDEIDGMGFTNAFPEDYFGTAKPFYAQFYEDVQGRSIGDRRVKPADAISALRRAISSFDESSDGQPAAVS